MKESNNDEITIIKIENNEQLRTMKNSFQQFSNQEIKNQLKYLSPFSFYQKKKVPYRFRTKCFLSLVFKNISLIRNLKEVTSKIKWPSYLNFHF